MIVYALRVVLLLAYFLIICVLGLFLCLLRPLNPRNTYYLGQMYGFGLLPLMGAKIHRYHAEKFDLVPGPAILVANHQENFDTFLVGHFCPKYTVSVGKRSIIYFPFFGLIYWLAGNILINRKNKLDALAAMDRAGQQAIDKNIKVIIMPEGTRSRGKGLKRFKKGAFYLAIRFQIPVIPIVVSDYSNSLDLKKIRSGEIHMEVLDPIETKGMEHEHLDELKELCYERMKESLARLNQYAT